MTVNKLNILTVFQHTDHYFSFFSNFVFLTHRHISEPKKSKDKHTRLTQSLLKFRKKGIFFLYIDFFLFAIFICLFTVYYFKLKIRSRENILVIQYF